MSRHLLAGPIVRRTSVDAVVLWLATRSRVPLSAEVYDASAGGASFAPPQPPRLISDAARVLYRIGATDAQSVETCALGPNLYVSLLTLRPGSGRFPVDTLLAYELYIDGESLAQQGLIDGPEPLVYEELALPSFVIASRLLRFLHGSCRKLHGKGDDALVNADALIRATVAKPVLRPALLMLSGDQIYADDVHDGVYRAMVQLCDVLAAPEEMPGLPADLSSTAPGGRQKLVSTAQLTSSHAANHALRFGEYAALYLLAWNPELSLAGADISSALDQRARLDVAAARRVLANVPTYMVFDDHEVTDDWNLNRDWRDAVQRNPAGRRIVSNGLAAYWAFQGWGNEPARFDAPFKATLSIHLLDPQAGGGDAFDAALWQFPGWSFATPTAPTVLALDLRTQRGREQNHLGAVDLLGDAGQSSAREALTRAGAAGDRALLVVSPTPVTGIDVPERLQEEAAAHGDSFGFDTESWAAKGGAQARLLTLLSGFSGGKPVVLLSGDVHYGFHALLRFDRGGRQTVFAQLTSSALKNSGALPRALAGIDVVQDDSLVHEVGWDQRPAGIIDTLERAMVAMLPEMVARLGLRIDPVALHAGLIWGRVTRAMAKATRRDARFDRFDRLFRELRRMRYSRDPLRLPRELAVDLGLGRWSWELQRELVPFDSALGTRRHVVGETNLGDVLALLSRRQISSLLTQRKGGRLRGQARASIDLGGTPIVRGARAGGRHALDAQRELARRHPAEAVALHLLEWYQRNRDESWGKPVIPFAEFPLEVLPRHVLPAGRGDLMKCQVHTISFHVANTSAAALGARLLALFPTLIPPAEARAMPNPAGPLRLGSEIRWLINPPGRLDDELRRLASMVLSGPKRLALTDTTSRRIGTLFDPAVVAHDPILRRFDTRVIELGDVAAGRFAFTVATLSNHPYGGRRLWSIEAGAVDGLYQLVSVEFNSYAWLVDLLVEVALDAGPTNTLWRGMFTAFVAAVGGVVTRPADPQLWNLIRQPALPVADDTEFLHPETINRSPLSLWLRNKYPTMGAMVNRVFGAS